MWVEMSAEDADRMDLNEGDLVEVASRRGSIRAPLRVSGVRRGVVFAPFHYGGWDQPQGADPTAANELTITEWDPVSKQPLFKVAAVRVSKVADGDAPAPAPDIAASAMAGGAR